MNLSTMPAEGTGGADSFSPASSIPQPFGVHCGLTQPLNFDQNSAMGSIEHNADQVRSQYSGPASGMVDTPSSIPGEGAISRDELVSNASGRLGSMWATS